MELFFRRKNKYRLDNALMKVPLFRGITRKQAIKLTKRAYVRYYKKDETVFYKDEPAYGLFIVLRGRVDIKNDGKVISAYEPFNAFGEFALLKDATRTADAITKTDSTLCYLFKEDIRKIFLSEPKLCIKIYQNLLSSAVDTIRRSS